MPICSLLRTLGQQSRAYTKEAGQDRAEASSPHLQTVEHVPDTHTKQDAYLEKRTLSN